MSDTSPLAMLPKLFAAVRAKIAANKRAKTIAAKIAETFESREAAEDVHAVLAAMLAKPASDATQKVKDAAAAAAAEARGALSGFKSAAADLPLHYWLPTADGVRTVRAVVEAAAAAAELQVEELAAEIGWLEAGKAPAARIEKAQDRLDNATKGLVKLRGRLSAAADAAAATAAAAAADVNATERKAA